MTKSLTPSGGTIHVLQSKPWLKSIIVNCHKQCDSNIIVFNFLSIINAL